MFKAGIIASGVNIPERVLDNEMLSAMVDTNDEWIMKRVGIKTRRINADMPNWELGLGAAQNALENAGLAPSDIDGIIACTATPDFYTPSLACVINGKLGAAGAFSFDVSAGCTGFIYALDIAASYIESGRAKNILVVASEMLSRMTNYNDRSTCVLFGDGAGAVVLSAVEAGGMLSSYITADGTSYDAIIAKAMGNVTVTDDGLILTSDNNMGEEGYIAMNGKEVYKFAVGAFKRSLDTALERVGLTYEDIDTVVSHQANIRIIESFIEKSGIDPARVPTNIERFGNTSSASVAILFHELYSSGRIKKGDRVAFVGFGAGLTCGACVFEI